MTTRFVILPCVVAVAIAGCTRYANSSPHPQQAGFYQESDISRSPPSFESLAYSWDNNGMTVTFYRASPNSNWVATVRDSWDSHEQAIYEHRVWGLTTSKCSKDELVRIVDRSLTKFRIDRPNAKLTELHVEMQLARELWGETLAELRRTLSALEGKATGDGTEVPEKVADAIGRVLDQSITVAEIKTLLRQKGETVQFVFCSWGISFKPSVVGKKWSEIAELPDVGICIPTMVAFDLKSQQRKKLSTNSGPDASYDKE
jgi:hypothetical protein